MPRKTKVSDLEQEIYGYMPSTFVVAYYELVREGYAGLTDSIEKSRQGLGVTRGSPPGSEGAVLRSEESLARKRVIDRRLRALARMDDSGPSKAPVKCVSCGQFGQEGWKYCANCGKEWSEGGVDVGVDAMAISAARKWVRLR